MKQSIDRRLDKKTEKGGKEGRMEWKGGEGRRKGQACVCEWLNE